VGCSITGRKAKKNTFFSRWQSIIPFHPKPPFFSWIHVHAYLVSSLKVFLFSQFNYDEVESDLLAEEKAIEAEP